ncbi:MAG: ribbon-helix-helix protein, CopG family [Planctomycetota bacterium]|jgi:predicted transcriptional regulator
MTQKKKRITITLPPDLVAAADRRAEDLDRSRSWVVAEALRAHLLRDEAGAASAPAPSVAEPAASYAAAEVAEARRSRLRSEAALPPEERLRRAEELGRLARQAQARGPRRVIIIFDSYEDFYEWRKSRLIGA